MTRRQFYDVLRPTDELQTSTHTACHHAVMGQSPDRRADHLSGRRDRYGAAASVTGRRETSVQLDFASETLHASVRAAGGSLSIPELTRCHAVVGQLPDP